MPKKQKNNLYGIINGLGILLGLYLWYKSTQQVIGLIAVFIIPPIIGGIIINVIPNKVQKKKSSKNKAAITTKGKSSYNTTQKEHSLLRTEKEILTLPLEELSWREFERLCYFYYKSKGYKPIETSEGADGGVDLILYNRHHKANVAIQIKHWKSGKQVTVKEIRELASAKKNHNCLLADFITSSIFTKAALQEADKFNIKCFDIEWVSNKILQWRTEEAKRRKYA